jgi:CRISPR type I-A-associated protein Csa5
MHESTKAEEFRSVSVSLAAVVLYTGSYSVTDRLHHALNPEVVARSIYDVARTLAVAKEDIKEEERKSDSKTHIVTKISTDEGHYEIWGRLAYPDEMKKFLDEASNDLLIARKVAAVATFFVAEQYTRPKAFQEGVKK